ncbi:MAG: hypothetical protein AB7E51_08485 [Pseudodesulfovibrio sp.]|uniref:hypothetical protein n=1 Tax=Pseudodesulfovibrio sp. TaxID=2035812 RepID=UPI003D0AACAE
MYQIKENVKLNSNFSCNFPENNQDFDNFCFDFCKSCYEPVWFDRNLYAPGPVFKQFSDNIAAIALPKRGIKADRLAQHFEIVLANILSNRGRLVLYERDQNRWPSNRINSLQLKAKYIKYVVDTLAENELIFHEVGRRGRASRMTAHNTLIDLFTAIGPIKFRSHPSRECIILRDAEGRNQPYGWELPGKRQDPQFVVGMRDRLAKVNAMLSDADLAVGLPEHGLDLDRVFLRRIFNGGWKSGGRHYGGFWQNAPKEVRKHILIDSAPTVECDFSASQANLLYLKTTGKVAIHDPYTLPEYEGNVAMRQLVKFVFMSIFNDNFTDIHDKIDGLCRQVKVSKKLSKASKECLAALGMKNLLKCVRSQNAAIWGYVGSGVWSEIHYSDSVIAERVLDELAGKGIVCLPIFDSFIVKREHEAALRSAMRNAYLKLWPECPAIKSIRARKN